MMAKIFKFPDRKSELERYEAAMERYVERQKRLQRERILASVLVVVGFAIICVILYKFSRFI